MTQGAHDFDFLIGKWQVRHRRLKDRLSGCDEWQTFSGTCSAAKVLGGLGNVDDNVIDLPGEPYRALTIRSFDPAAGQWVIWWLDGRRPHTLDAPLAGRFSEGVGRFEGKDTWQGQPIVVRFAWTMAGADTPHWEQAFSKDGGETWETNWTMTFVRQGDAWKPSYPQQVES